MKSLFLSLVFCSVLFVGCDNSNPVLCTKEFRTVGVEVTGKTLNSWYTVREKNGDTLILNTSFQNIYGVLDDNFQKTLANKQETFIFHGVISDSVWIKEAIEIKADACHIEYVSGNLKINL